MLDIGKRFLSPGGAGLVIICFFLPWVKFQCAANEKTYNMSGLDFARHVSMIWLVLVAAVFIIAVFFYYSNKNLIKHSKPIIITTAIMGILVPILKYGSFWIYGYEVQLLQEKFFPSDIETNMQFGIIGIFLGFILSIVGIILLNYSLGSEEDDSSYDKNTVDSILGKNNKISLEKVNKYLKTESDFVDSEKAQSNKKIASSEQAPAKEGLVRRQKLQRSLVIASLNNNIEKMKAILEDSDIDVNKESYLNDKIKFITPLQAAVYNNRLEAIDLLLSKGANFNQKNAQGMSAMMIATVKGRKTIIDKFSSYEGRNVENDQTKLNIEKVEDSTDIFVVRTLKLSHSSGKEINISNGDVIGRKVGEHVNFFKNYRFVSGKHGCFYNKGTSWFYEDLGSSNGSFHNGLRLTPNTKVELTSGDRITISNESFTVSF